MGSASLRIPLQGLAPGAASRAPMAAVQTGTLQPWALWGEAALSAPATKTGSRKWTGLSREALPFLEPSCIFYPVPVDQAGQV